MGFRTLLFLVALAAFLGGWMAAESTSFPALLVLAAAVLILPFGVFFLVRQRVDKEIREFLLDPGRSKALSWLTDLLDPVYEGTVRLSRERDASLGQEIETSSRFSAVLDNMVEGVVVTDLKGKILLVNRAFSRFFRTDGPVRGESFGLLSRKAGINDLIESVLVQRKSVQKEIVFSDVSPPRTWSLLGTTAHGAGTPEKVYGVFLLYDLTEIRHLERVRRDFVANVSHEIRTPLTSIRGFAEALLDGAMNDPESSREFLGIILNHAERLGAIVTDLLHLSQMESGKEVPSFKSVFLEEQLDRIRSIYQPIADKKEIRFTVDVTPPGLVYETDEGKMDLVLGNLVDNALKYTRQGGEVRVSAREEDQSVVIDVRDTGIGIPRTDVDRVFERFYRVDRARSREAGGTGLGLAIVKHVVEILRGSVRVVSQPGEGSTFTVRVPKGAQAVEERKSSTEMP
jgi:two-component system phosphate regulon sensor histidine kinase PhoR